MRQARCRGAICSTSSTLLKSRKRVCAAHFLHGRNLRGNDLKKLHSHGPPTFLAERADFPFIAVRPQLPEGSRPCAGSNRFLDELLERYPFGQNPGLSRRREPEGGKCVGICRVRVRALRGPRDGLRSWSLVPVSEIHPIADTVLPRGQR